ncbi:hypothetical protein J2S41_000923 [Catenuloplanes atrovinosus]|uniref:Uncharacterized protein n=1 Tax=Catenuloplanes atrovinosus TaxID=137266 RepID=A0AAE3YIJ8_9ACTN|nr:hypothetical protein [Catenuloplanes atrovinosus]
MSREAARGTGIGTADRRDRPSGGGENRRRGARSSEGPGRPAGDDVTSVTAVRGGGRVACGPVDRALPVRGGTLPGAGERFVAWWVMPGAHRPGTVSPGGAQPIGTGHGRPASVTVAERVPAGPGTTGRDATIAAGAAVTGRTWVTDRVSVETERVVA